MTESDAGSVPTRPILTSPTKDELLGLDQQRRTELQPVRNGWKVWSSVGSANLFHHYRPERTNHEVWIRSLHRPALILGSTQPASVLTTDAYETDLEICRRRSGGGLVMLNSDRDVWIDVMIPSDSPLWHHDVAKSFNWLGQTWAQVLEKLFPSEVVEVHHRSGGTAGRVLCFASVGYGEVTVGGRKVLGLSQRRTRNWARLQCAVVQQWPADLLVEVMFSPDGPDPRKVAAGLPPHVETVPPARVIDEFLAELTSTNLV